MWHNYFCLLLAITLAFPLSGNTQELSSFSQFGLGEIRNPGFTPQSSMGRISSAYYDNVHVNFNNPASYSHIKLTTLEGGMGLIKKTIKTEVSSQPAKNAALDFIAIAFPIKRNLAVSAGILPYSTVKYNFEVLDTFQAGTDTTSFKKAFNGNGNINQLYLGAGIKFPMNNDSTKHQLSIGFNAIYLFGKTRFLEFIDFTGGTNFFGPRKNINVQTGDAVMQSGIQYSIRLNKKWEATFGFNAFMPFNVRTTTNEIWDRIQVNSNGVFILDTILNTKDVKTQRKFPFEYGTGFMLKKGSHFLVASDIHLKDWSSFNDILNPEVTFSNSVRWSIGTEIMPNFKGRANTFKKIRYRLGGYYDTGTLNLNNKDITEYGITFGIGLPLRSGFSFLNIGMEIGKKGTVSNNLIQENFIRTYIGFTLNDKWFNKRKYD